MAGFTKKYILNEDFMYLPLSDDFKTRAARMGFQNIRQIIKTRQSDVEAMEDYSVDWMIELSELAEQYDFLWELERDSRFS
jgi:hypothetical protein